MQCVFCKVALTRRELTSDHKCSAVYPIKEFPITEAMVVNSDIIPKEFYNITKCFFCGDYLRNASQCQQCLISCCELCINASQGSQSNLNCPNSNCGVTNKFQPISRMAKNLLEKLKIECQECKMVVNFDGYDTHQLTHHFCTYCSKSLTNYRDIRQHYYNDCLKFQIDCENCEFVFKRESYMMHDCLQHYQIRKLELLLVVLTLVG